MLIVALVLAVIGLASLVTAVVTGNELIAWVCIGASVLGVILLIVDAIRERQTRSVVAYQDIATASDDAVAAAPATVDSTYENFDAEYPDEAAAPAAETADAVVDEHAAETPIAPVDELDVADEDADSPTKVEFVGEDESDTTVERVTEADPDEKLEDK